MTICRFQCSFPNTGGDTEDTIVNNWYFDVTSADEEGNIAPVATALDTFYTTLIALLAGSHAWTTGRLKVYDIAEPTPRAPLYDDVLAIGGTPASTRLPAECAVCLSFQGDQTSGVRQARRRGRVYLGPWGTAANDSTTGLISTGVTGAIDTAATALLTASATDPDWAWIVWSPTTSTAVPVTNGWVDNAWDTVRSRGIDATTRVTF